MDRIEDSFQIAGESVPRNSIINSPQAELLLRMDTGWYGLESRVAPVPVTPRSSLLPSPSEWISQMPTCKVLAQEPITSTSTPDSADWCMLKPAIESELPLLAQPVMVEWPEDRRSALVVEEIAVA